MEVILSFVITSAKRAINHTLLLLFSTFILHFSRPFHNRSILLNASVSCGGAAWWLMPVSCFQFDCSVKQLNSTCECCFLLLLVLLNELLTHCSFVNFCRSMKKSFQGQGGSQCDTFLLRCRTMMPFQE